MDKPIGAAGVLDVIKARSSVRSYAGGKIDKATVNSLLEAAVRAPTAMHEEPWQFAVIQDEALLKRISDRAKGLFLEEARRLYTPSERGALAAFAQPDFNVFYDAGTLIIICAKALRPFVVADCWLAAENLMLAAQARGLGTCVIGSAASALNLPAVKEEIGLPPGTTAVAPIIVGTPSGDWPATARKKPEILVWR